VRKTSCVLLSHVTDFLFDFLSISFLKTTTAFTFAERKYKVNLKYIFFVQQQVISSEFPFNFLSKTPTAFTFTERKYKVNLK